MVIAGFEITEILKRALQTKYPTVDLEREYPLMVLWITKNPSKTPKNALRFVENWLKKVQDKDAKALLTTRSATVERIGTRVGVTPRPGETQEQYNRRVIEGVGGSLFRRVA